MHAENKCILRQFVRGIGFRDQRFSMFSQTWIAYMSVCPIGTHQEVADKLSHLRQKTAIHGREADVELLLNRSDLFVATASKHEAFVNHPLLDVVEGCVGIDH